MYDGIIDYLEIMSLAGVSELPKLPKADEKRASADEPEIKAVVPPVSVEKPAQVVFNEPIAASRIQPDTQPIQAEVPPLLPRSAQLQQLALSVARCTKCQELSETRTQTVFGIGNPDAELVFIGEAPGADEDKQGVPFVGRAGQLLTDVIEKGMKISRSEVYICNILRCRPPGNRNPLPEEAFHCRPFLDKTLEIIKPRFICCLGAVAAKNLFQTEETIGKMRGKLLDYKGIKVVCTYHPAYLLRNPSAKKDTWEDVKMLMREMGLK
ncbi:uracil-DNA glycosylase [Planctomycetales bacterium]|nr:uracil-DNA glycosylase [Planctomycetales bacterium]